MWTCNLRGLQVSVFSPAVLQRGPFWPCFVLHFFCLIGWWRCFFELLSGTSVPHHPPLTAGKPLVTASQPAAPQCASCKGAFKGGRHGCQRRVLGHGNPLTFLSGKCCKFQGFALRDTLRDACLTGSLCASLYGMPSGNHL